MTTDTTTAAAAAARTAPPDTPPTEGAGAQRRPRSWAGLWFVLPFAAFYVLFLLWPSLAGLGYSFTDRSLAGGPVNWIGLANWAETLSDPALWDSLWNTLWFTILSVPPLVIAGLALALLTDRARRMGWFLRFSFFAPFVLPVAVMSMIWVWIYQPGFGLVNQYLTALGLSEVEWLGDERTVMIAIVIATTWWTVGFNYLLYLAALQSIPKEMYEAADLDGAGGWQKVWGITLPLLKRTTALVIVLQLIASLRIFDQAYLMTNGTGGPNFAARTIIHYIYESGFVNFRIGLASAMAYVLFVVIVLASVVQFRLFTRNED